MTPKRKVDCPHGLAQLSNTRVARTLAFRPASPEPGISYGPGDYIDWPDAESVELIVFAMVMLNGDLHNPENAEKMTREQFIQNIQRSGAKVVLTEDALKDMYVCRCVRA